MDLMQMLRLNLQFFSQDDTGGSNTDSVEESKEDIEDGNEDKQGADKQKDEKTFTQSELEEIIKQRLARAEKDKQEAIKEAEKLAKMNAEQKREYELEKTQRENEELKAKLNRFELGKEATSMLSEQGIVANDEILDFVVRENAEQTKTAVEAFSKLVKELTEQLVREKLKGNSPTKQTTQTATMSKEEIMSIRDTEKRQRLIKENIHLFQN